MIRELLSYIGVYNIYQRWLRREIEQEQKPKHIGIIMDGNRRWAKAHSLVPWEGHWEGASKVEEFLQWCLDLDIRTVTLYSFSTENFRREEEEINELMKLFERTLEDAKKSESVHKNKVRIRALGRIEELPERLSKLIKEIEESTKNYEDYYLNIAIAYGGRAEIVDSARKIAQLVKEGELNPEDINEQTIEKYLYTAHLPQQDPDLVIRTSGESRLSNFLVWQAAYSELFIVDVFWPEFRKLDFMRAIRSYQQRQRRFGV
jgi:tritrans,polycis-undecaprenyl-diphosphate synthase [geranylgeranyl-diphosphate specific]